MFSTTLSLLPHMMAHASSAGAPFDSEVSNADLDSEVSVTTPSATPSSPSTTTTTTTTTSTRTTAQELQQLVMLSQLMDSTSTALPSNHHNLDLSSDSTILSHDPSIIAMTSSSSSSSSSSAWSCSPSISPMVLKLESPVLTHLAEPTLESSRITKSRRASSTAASSTATAASNTSNSRKRSAADPMDKEAKARERVLRNRAAAQESRDKKRKYMSEIEASNESLQEENCQLLKRLKTVESDNHSLSQRLESLAAQFSLMQQQLAMSMSMSGVISTNSDNKNSNNNENNINNQPGVGFCQSAVLAKKAKSNILTNSPQQKLTPSKGKSHTMTSTPNKHRRVFSMTMMNSMSKTKGLNREARLSVQSAAQNRMEISCRPFCNNSRKKTLTLSSSAAASFPTARTRPLAVFMMVFLTNMLPQLMLNFSTLFLISTGARSNNPQTQPLPLQEQRLRQLAQSFIQQRLLSSRRSNLRPQQDIRCPSATAAIPQSGSIKDTITSLNSSVIEEIITEFRQGRKSVARGLLVRALLSSPKTLDNDSIKGLFLFRKD